MASEENDSEPGPSHIRESSSSRRVQFGVKDDDSENQTESQSPSQRRASMVGQSGYVSQLLEEYLEDDTPIPVDEPLKKPIRKQSLAERRASVKAIETDVSYYMREVTTKSPSLSLSIKKSGSRLKLPTIVSSKEKLEELTDLSQQLPEESRASSEWRPSHTLEGVQADEARSWVGTYIIGKDYWTAEDNGVEEKPKTVSFSMDEERKPWYEMPLRKPIAKESRFRLLKLKSMEKIEALKEKIDEDYEEKRKKRLILAAHARQEPKIVDEWSEEFKGYFQDISRTSEFSQRGTNLSMVDTNKWLEKAGILDHNELTLIHTGFCFMSCNGTRHQGLSFTEFTQFLQMISYTTKLPLRDIVRRLTACQRKPGHFAEETVIL